MWLIQLKQKNPKEESPCFSSCQSVKHKDSPNISHALLSPPERLRLSQGDIIKHHSEIICQILLHQTSLLYNLTYFEAVF